MCKKIIEGLIDKDTIEHLLRQQELTLEAAITICRAQEVTKKQYQAIQDDNLEAVMAIRQQRQQPPAQQQQLPTLFPGW